MRPTALQGADGEKQSLPEWSRKGNTVSRKTIPQVTVRVKTDTIENPEITTSIFQERPPLTLRPN